jgi:A/G-specific adenine glycosylase
VQRVWVGPDDAPASERDLLQLAEGAVPAGHGWAWNQAIMELGALVCTASKPRCQICPLRSACRAYAAWCAADEAVFSYQPARPKLAKVAERSTPFASTPRYFRGRIVDVLRQQEPGAWLPLATLGEQIKPNWTPEDAPWLIQLVHGLAADGLAELDAAQQHARLP